MDSLLNFAAGQLQNQMSGHNNGNNQNQQQGNNNGQQQQQFNNNNNQNQQQQQNQPQGGFQAEQSGGLNLGALLAGANQQHGNGDALSGLIQNAMGHVQNVSPSSQISEQKVQENHDEAYNQGNASNMTASAMGSAAAIQAFKSFASGGGLSGLTGGNGGQQQGGGSLISKLIGMAMSEAAKLFDKSGGAASGNKQDVLNSAGETMMKLMVQNQIQGALSGGSGGGSQATQLLGLATKFLS